MSNLTKWGDWGDDQAKADTSLTKAGQKNYLKLTVGDNIVRFLPPKPGKATPLTATFNHFIEMPDGRKVSFNCPRMMAQRPCVACTKAQQLSESRSAVDKNAAKRMFPKLRVFANVVDRNSEALGVQVYGFGKTIMDELTSIRNNPRKGGNFTHPITGRDIIISRSGTTQNDTRYSVSPDIQATPLHQDSATVDFWLNTAYDLTSFAEVLDDETIRAKLNGEEVERPAARVVNVKPRGRSIEDDADSFEEDAPF